MPEPPTPPTPPFHPGCYCYRDEAAAAARSAGLLVRCGGGLPCLCMGTSSHTPFVLDDVVPTPLPSASAEISPPSKSPPSFFHSLDSLLDPQQHSPFPSAPLQPPPPPALTPLVPTSNSFHPAASTNPSVCTKRPRPHATCECPCADLHRAAAAKARKCCGGQCTCPPGVCKCDTSLVWTHLRCCGENVPSNTEATAASFSTANRLGATGCCGGVSSAGENTAEVGRDDLLTDLTDGGDNYGGTKGTCDGTRGLPGNSTGLISATERRAAGGLVELDGRLNERRRGQADREVESIPLEGGGVINYAGRLGDVPPDNANVIVGVDTAARGSSACGSFAQGIASLELPDFGMGLTDMSRGVGPVEVHPQALANYTADLLTAAMPSSARGIISQQGGGVYSVPGGTAIGAADVRLSEPGRTNRSKASPVVEKCASCRKTSPADGAGKQNEGLRSMVKESYTGNITVQQATKVEISATKSGENVANASSNCQTTTARGSSLDFGTDKATNLSVATTRSGQSGDRGRGRRRRSATYNGAESRDRAFACHLCSSTFFFKQNRDRHINEVHLGKRPYKCEFPGCKGAFKNRSGLKQHVRTVHEKARPFKCDKCDSTFGQRNHLTQHVLVVHDKVKMFQCEFCGMSFSNVGNRTQHIRRRHPDAKPRTGNSQAVTSSPSTNQPDQLP
eukprot:GFKZ01002290.1.p1 GENE.GFKZ01002290.1~~GFKZ01002290.1.p1  ORF type:complete len:699 (-),score=48.50 GFKZ01002290.1:1053-3089(-)